MDEPTASESIIRELRETVAELRAEIVRLRDEIRSIRRDHHETPPHYL